MSESKELAILNDIPAYALAKASPEAFGDLLGGLSAGSPPSIRVRNGKFRLVVGGEETAIPAKNLAESEFLPVIILAAKKTLSKAYYASAYDPAHEPEAPDCWSLDAIKPDAQVKNPICEDCANCPMNAFGSGRNAAGAPTKGKACTDSKILAVAYAGGVYQFKIPPASLKPFGAYIRTLMNRSVPPGNVVTFIGIDESADFPQLTFRPGAFVPEGKIERLVEMSESTEVKDIIQPTFIAQAPKQVEDKTTKDAAPKGGVDPLGDGEEEEQEEVKKPAPKKTPAKKAPAKKVEPVEEDDEEDGGVPSDDELNSLLGFD